MLTFTWLCNLFACSPKYNAQTQTISASLLQYSSHCVDTTLLLMEKI
uniref:Uncharacterized protein n=1 Tax=Anguilla anguilla TaxID=7936 RepID=A0A0E9UM73_ANGAN